MCASSTMSYCAKGRFRWNCCNNSRKSTWQRASNSLSDGLSGCEESRLSLLVRFRKFLDENSWFPVIEPQNPSAECRDLVTDGETTLPQVRLRRWSGMGGDTCAVVERVG